MSPSQEPFAPLGGGCVRALVALPVLLVLAPAAAVVRTISRWRRGRRLRCEINTDPATPVVEVLLDVPASVDPGRSVTWAVARFAEATVQPGDAFVLAWVDARSAERTVTTIGASVQALADRFYRSLRQGGLNGRTALWLCLPRGIHSGQILDVNRFDPDRVDGWWQDLQGGARWVVAVHRLDSAVSRWWRLGFLGTGVESAVRASCADLDRVISGQD